MQIEVEGLRIGVRTTADHAAHLRRALGDLIVDSSSKKANYSVRISKDPRTFHVLYRGGCTEVRTLDRHRLAVALSRHLGPRSTKEGSTVDVDCLAVVIEGNAVLLPTDAREPLIAIDRRLRGVGAIKLDARQASVDIERGELVVETRAIDPARFDGLLGLLPQPIRDEPVVSDGRYPVVRWGFRVDGGRSSVLSRAHATSLASSCINPRSLTLDRVSQLASLFEKVPAVSLPVGSRAEALEFVTRPQVC